VLEHLDAWRLPIFQRVLLEFIQPKTVIVTTPNVEFNVNYPGLSDGKLRHHDHRFEFDRPQFTQWAQQAAQSYGYTVKVFDIGELDPETGRPTQIGVFTKCN
jgi:hypothetical protein